MQDNFISITKVLITLNGLKKSYRNKVKNIVKNKDTVPFEYLIVLVQNIHETLSLIIKQLSFIDKLHFSRKSEDYVMTQFETISKSIQSDYKRVLDILKYKRKSVTW